jgi:antitoxin component of MazEF toxin-antitoxin module
LGIKEGDRLQVTIKGDMIIIRPVPRLFVKRRSWASTTIEGLEAESEELVKRLELGG